MELTQSQKDMLREINNNAKSDSQVGLIERFSMIVREYLKYKNREAYYMIDYDSCNEDGPEYRYLKLLTDENIADIKATVKGLDPNDEVEFDDLVNDEPDAFSTKEYLYDIGRYREELIVRRINLDTKYHCYKFKVADFSNGLEVAPIVDNINICLTDEEYIYLTAESMIYKCCHYPGVFTLNRLRTANPELYDKICDTIDSSYFDINNYPCVVPTYVAEFVETEADGKMLATVVSEQ